MIIKANLELGNSNFQFEIDERSEMEALHKAVVLANPKTYCNECKNTDIGKFKMTSNKDKEGNIYVNVKCTSCGARSKLGQYKVGGYFWHDFEKFVPKAKSGKDTDLSPFDE